ncbi:MAG TPA: HAMP domain-containing sensor histidine kinase [Minicystis sp.]|nr:HAMP domain-containing sensor histidine kinase [Minicystis sp.]
MPRRAATAASAKREALALAHALRTPLTALSLAAEMLQDERLGALTASQRELASTVVRESGRLRLVLDRALRTERLGAHAGPVDRDALDLGALVAQALQPFGAQASAHRVRIAQRLARGVWVVGDALKLAWVASTLVGNALRFSRPGGRIDVAVAAKGERCGLRVRDHGPGIARSRRRAVFARQGGGARFLVQEVVHAHGGTIRLTPTSEGASFVVTLPRSAPKENLG